MSTRVRTTSELELAASKRAQFFLDTAIESIQNTLQINHTSHPALVAAFMQAAATSYLAEVIQDHVGDSLDSVVSELINTSNAISRNS